ncbi:ribose-phosphate diphosphokinase [Anaerorhabdus sp.]|uniref:ribose-phosphate diphosphokinase n=1 Tax=Anaerorhabdus sp. TaxID=1872524 RepID=UPI002B215735|nr:ribose-phosphate pyrophosphokinase [Anaerorhabdus sp.]MEA4874429.1 ribose-phosphate pyrophosphokinase [Anaerorhabdus sp.]
MNETIVFALTSSVDLANEIVDHLNLPLGKISVKHFADGEILVEPEETVRGRSVYIVQSTCAPVTERLMEVLICIDACKRASAGEINVVMPYYGYARQDRKARARQPITAKLVADLLQVAGANRLITIDLHASQIQGFFNVPIDDLTAVPMIGQYFKSKALEDIVVVSPDHGGTTRARKLADAIGAPLAIVDKRRPKPNVAEAMNVIGEVEGKTVIVIDDIVDTAGSLVASINILKDKGAKEIYCACTHGVLSGPAIERIENSPIKEMVITNTIPLPQESKERTTKITSLSVAYMISKTIEAIQTHCPVSDVYDLFAPKND